MNSIKLKNSRKNDVRKYLLTGVASCTFTFSNGVKAGITSSPNNEIVLIKLIPCSSKLKLLEYSVLNNYSSVKNISELAKLSGYNCIKTFTRHFKKSFGQTPYQWVLDRKMEEINSLVINSDVSITDIAAMYDFKSISHLIALYTKRYGLPPHKNRLSKLSGL